MVKKYKLQNDGPIRTHEVNSFENLRDLIENTIPRLDEYVFRGQADSEWNLEPTLTRLIHRARRTGVKHGPVGPFVDAHLDRFKLEIRGRRGDNPARLEEDDLWALGQHYGLATPLLDWSVSPYISTFFALESIKDEDNPRVLWCLNRLNVERINKGLADEEKLQLIFPDSDDNKRLLGQSGLFSKGPVMKSVDKWVKEKAKKSDKAVLIKISFPRNFTFRKAALKKLKLMNINHSTLFPDLFGASQHCNIVSEDYEA